MFVHQGRLEPALAPTDYVDPAVFERERERIFAHAWHPVGTRETLSARGAQRVVDVMGRSIVVRNEDGRLVAFHNVCPHRHSRIARDGDSCAPTLRCQYHGWEFDSEGQLSHLPDGRSFKGFKAREVCLVKASVETLGSLVFVHLDAAAPPLRDAFGETWTEAEARFANTRLVLHQRSEHTANWKIAVENAVESYHVPRVHPETFTNYLAEEFHDHRLAATFSSYRPTSPPSLRERIAFAGYRVMLAEPRAYRYAHVHVFPNLLISYSGAYVELATVVPMAADRTLREAWGFVANDVRANPVSRAIDRVHSLLMRRAVDAVTREDASIWPEVQRGMAQSPFRGVLSAREERVWHFQQWVASQLA